MPVPLLVYRYEPGGPKLAAKLVPDDQGKVFFVPGETNFDEVVSLLGDGVFSPVSRTFVTSDRGEDFLEAVEEMLGHSSMWSTRRAGAAPGG